MADWEVVGSRKRVIGSRPADVAATKRWTGGAWVDVTQHQRNTGEGIIPPPPAPTMRIGLRTKDSTGASTAEQATAWNNATAIFGPMTYTRGLFHSGGVPSTADYFTPPSVLQIPSFKKVTSALTTYAPSMRSEKKLIFNHEPEGGEYPNGAAFVAAFRAAYNAVKAADPTVQVGMAAGGFRYRTGRSGADGSYIPPPDKCDFYSLDTYRNGVTPGSQLGPIKGLEEFKNWYNLVKNLGRDLYITEYGRGWENKDGSVTRAQHQAILDARPQLMKDDYLYLKELGFKGFLYWWNSNSPGDDWKFTDQPSIDAWAWIAAQEAG